MDLEGSAIELGRLVLFLVDVVPARGRRPLPVDADGPPWKADMACEFKNGIGGLRGGGDNGRDVGVGGGRRPEI